MKKSNENDSFYSSLSDEYKSGFVKVFYSNNVSYVLTTNETVDRYLVIMTNGLYLVERGGFYMNHIRILIPFYSLLSISITGNTCSFSSMTQQIRIKSDELNKIISIVYFIRVKQFPLFLFPLTLHIPKDYHINVDIGKNIYSSKTIFADRITSCALYYGIDLNHDDIDKYYEITELPFHQFVINQDIRSSKLYKPIICSLAFEQNLHTLIFKDSLVSQLIKDCNTIFLHNKCVSKLIFDNCDFIQSKQALASIFEKNQDHKLYFSKLVFKNCNLKIPDFLQFFELLSTNINAITSLSFDHSEMDSTSLDSVFQLILFNETFHSLESLEINSIGSIPDIEYEVGNLATCSWALTSKCIKKLYVNGCNFDASRMLMTILNFDIGLNEIHLSNNQFSTRIPSTFTPKSAFFLDLSSCDIQIQAMSSLIESFANKKIDIHGLDLSSLRLSEPEMIQMLALMSSDFVVLPHLETFYFDNNRLGPEETILLSKFIKNQPSLKRISLNCSIDITKTSNSLDPLFQSILEKQIEALYLRGDDTLDFSFGKLILPLLQAIYEKHL